MTPERSDEPRIVQLDACRATVLWQTLVLTVWRSGAMRVDALREFGRIVCERGATLAPKRLTLVVLVSETATVPTGAVVPALIENAQTITPYLRAQAMVLSAKGVRAAAAQSLMASLMVAVRGALDEETFDLDSDAIPWVYDRARVDDPSLTIGAVREAFAWVRERVY